jgi:hypothetical protein
MIAIHNMQYCTSPLLITGDVCAHEPLYVEKLAAGARSLHVLSLRPTQEPEVGQKGGSHLWIKLCKLIIDHTLFSLASVNLLLKWEVMWVIEGSIIWIFQNCKGVCVRLCGCVCVCVGGGRG